MQPVTGKEIYTQKILAGKQIYSFDVIVSKENVRYLVIRDDNQNQHQYQQIIVSEESMDAFISALNNANNALKQIFPHYRKATPEKDARAKTYTVENIRTEYPNAYAKWSINDDDNLRQRYSEGMEISELAKFFDRKEGAIRSRLIKLGLILPKNLV